ncbi:amino acid adenylation domain-containing protein [Ascidiimonas sp. W6]|uniref:amino acid adenylation domain-containing protein n=1 Tax=Ascidiimonas meishanensis TaxID=3128903 RepID=UPI0030ED9C9C
MKKQTLIEIAKSKSLLTDVGITFINGVNDEDFLSYAELYSSSLRILAFLQQKGLEPGEELLLQIEDNKNFILVFWACILGRIIPIPLTISHQDERKKKFYNVCEVLNKPHLIGSEEILVGLEKYAHDNGLIHFYSKVKENYINIDDILSLEAQGRIVEAQPDDLAFIQFSSGSTGNPKGVMLTHENLITNVKAIANAASYSSTDAMLSWMPLTHDMGLIGFHINPLYCGMNHYVIPTNVFVRRPSLWFEKASEHRVSILSSPNFGYKYIMKHCLEPEKYEWDLSSVRLIYNGAEPISEQLCFNFLEWGKVFGLRSQAMCPVYGLAEASLAVSISKLEDPIISCQLRRDTLNFGDKIVFTSEEEQAVSFVNVGTSIDNCDVAIADNAINLVEEEIIGHIVIKGDNVTSGYYNNIKKTKEVIKNGWLKTGDLGFLKDGCLYITGRDKDIIFVNGQNYYPHDIESIAQELEEIELNKIVVVGFFNTVTQVEETIAFIFFRGKPEKFVEIALAVRSHINSRIGVSVNRILPVKNIPRTTSGKLQRFKLLEEYIHGDHHEIETELAKLIQEYLKDNIQIVTPENEIEEKLLSIWKRMLNNEQIGVTNKFFEIGGTSLKAAEIIMTLESVFEVEIPFTVFYNTQTVRELAEKIGQFNKKEYVPISKAKEKRYYEISPAQQRIFYAWQLNKNSTAYNIPVAFTINGDLELQKVQETLNKLALRHTVLRASFPLVGTPKYTVKEHVNIPMEYLECKAREVDEILKKLVKPFDLNSKVLMRCAILNVENDETILFFDFQHIVMDGLSIQKFIKEFNHIYDKQPLEELPIEYKDYVSWQEDNIVKNKFKNQEKFWIDLFEDGVPILELPIDHPRPALLDTKGKRVKFQLTETTSIKLKELAKENAITLHMLIFSIHKWFLAKITRQTEIVIGIPVSGRMHIDLQNILGMFVNNLPILTKINKYESFTDSLKRDIELMKKCLANQDYPYSVLVDKLLTNRDVSRNPLFDTMFLFPPSLEVNKTETYSLSQRFFDPGFSKFDFSLEVFEEKQHLSYVVEHSIALFNTDIASYVSSYFERMIAQIIKDPHILFSDISLLDSKGLKDQINVFNATQVTFSDTETVLSLFEKQVVMKPNDIAIETDNKTITYRIVNEKAETFKRFLLQKKVTKGDVIAVSLPQSPELIYVLLGILKAGAVYLPIAEETPEERLKFIVIDSNSKYLVCLENKELTPSACECITLNTDFIKCQNEITPNFSILQQDTAYIIYTSGTTGNPKGVKVGHKSIANYLQWASKEYLNGESLAFPFFTSIDFDLTLTSIFLPLISGNKVVIYNSNQNEMPLKRVFTEHKSAIVKLTPSHIKVLINNKIPVASSIKKIIVGGEKLTSKIANGFLELCSHEVVIYNEYGPTEATVGCMVHRFEPFEDTITVPIGKPIANAKIYILDEFKKPVPKGVIGEIYIAGDCLGQGYINNETLTDEKFIPNPFVEGGLMYASGDLAKIMYSGIMEYIGRSDEQLKINGYRIEKEEIKQVLTSYKGIKDVVIISAPNNQEQLELYAYFMIDNTIIGEINEMPLKTWLLDKIPHYMIPKYFIQVDAIPLTKNGKTDIEKLLKLKQHPIDLNPDSISGTLSRKIVTVYKTVMENLHFGMQSNFYEFGGDSIKATQIASKLHQENIRVSPKEVLTYNTVAQLSYFLENNPDWEEHHVANYEQNILTGKKERTAVEKWFFDKKFTNPNFYNQSILLKLHQSIHKEALQRTFQELIIHHDGLRLNLDKKSGKLFYNTKHLERDIEVEEFALNSENELTECSTLVRNTFDLAHSLLIKVALIKLRENQEQFLFITAHHLVVDGISWRILLEDFYRIYHSITKAEEIKHLQKTASPSYFAKSLKQYYNEEKLAAELPYWEAIANTPFQLPAHNKQAKSTIKDIAITSIKVNQQTTEWLLKETAAYHVDILLILNTVLSKTIAKWMDTSKIKIELENHGRHINTVDVSRTVGWFTVMHPVVFDMEGTLLHNLQSVKEVMNNIPERGLGYGMLKHRMNSAKDTITPLRFNYLGQFGSELSNDFFSIEQQATRQESDIINQITATLEINAMVISGELSIEWSYDTKAFKEETIHMLKGLFLKYLHELKSELQKNNEPLLTPSDFDDLEISQNELDALFS